MKELDKAGKAYRRGDVEIKESRHFLHPEKTRRVGKRICRKARRRIDKAIVAENRL